MGKFELENGKRDDREAAKELRTLLGVPVTRTLQSIGSSESADLAGAIGLHLEVKRTERLSLYPALKQSESYTCENCLTVLH